MLVVNSQLNFLQYFPLFVSNLASVLIHFSRFISTFFPDFDPQIIYSAGCKKTFSYSETDSVREVCCL